MHLSAGSDVLAMDDFWKFVIAGMGIYVLYQIAQPAYPYMTPYYAPYFAQYWPIFSSRLLRFPGGGMRPPMPPMEGGEGGEMGGHFGGGFEGGHGH